MNRRTISDAELAGAGETLPTIEVDTADSYLAFSACETAICDALKVLAQAKKCPRVTVYVYESPSVNFGHPTNSVFFGVAGPERVLVSLYACLSTVPNINVRYGDYIPSARCVPKLHLEKGTLWQWVGQDEWEQLEMQ